MSACCTIVSDPCAASATDARRPQWPVTPQRCMLCHNDSAGALTAATLPVLPRSGKPTSQSRLNYNQAAASTSLRHQDLKTTKAINHWRGVPHLCGVGVPLHEQRAHRQAQHRVPQKLQTLVRLRHGLQSMKAGSIWQGPGFPSPAACGLRDYSCLSSMHRVHALFFTHAIQSGNSQTGSRGGEHRSPTRPSDSADGAVSALRYSCGFFTGMPSSASSRQRGTSCSGSPWKRPAAKVQANGHGLDASAFPTISEVLHRSNVHRKCAGLARRDQICSMSFTCTPSGRRSNPRRRCDCCAAHATHLWRQSLR